MPEFDPAIYSKGDPFSQRLALILPGKLDTKNYAHMQSHVDFLAAQGFHAVTFDPPGTWESVGDISLYTTTNYLVAIDELIVRFGNKPTLLVGHSYGGSIAMLAASRNAGVIGFVAIMSQARASQYSPSKLVNGTAISRRDMPGSPGKTREFALPLNFYRDAEKFNILEELKTCTKPKLFIAGKYDDVIKPELVKEAYVSSAEPKEFIVIDSDHDYRHEARLIKLVETKIGKFLPKLQSI
jgi:pimeloyl-ACP methyl ester carboxylesterase